MAYMGRGGFSSFRDSNIDDDIEQNDNNSSERNERMYYRGGVFRMHYYIPLDNTYVIFQMIATIIIFTIAGITFLITYKPSVIDPIESTKRLIINAHIIVILSLLIITLLANYFSKDKSALIKRIFVILLLSVITILVFVGIKVNLDSVYTKDKFNQIYEQEYSEQNSKAKSIIDIGLNGTNIKSEKEYYIDECLKAYNIFTIRMYGVIILNVLLIALLIYQLLKISKIQDNKDRLSKDDIILFDEEENVKM